VCLREGEVVGTPGFDKIRALKSFHSLMSPIKPGSHVELTVDLFTMVGTVVLLNPDAEALAADLDIIREMETTGTLFDYA
jgi:di/tripeptidase